MGAWDIGGFDNDDARDWLEQLDESLDNSLLEDTLAVVVDSKSVLEAPDCRQALAAAEVVAALNQRTAADLPKVVRAFVARNALPPSFELLQMAARAVQMVGTKSELLDLWAVSKHAPQWLEELANLEQRLL